MNVNGSFCYKLFAEVPNNNAWFTLILEYNPGTRPERYSYTTCTWKET